MTTVGSFVASVDVRQGKITFRSDKAATTGKARTAAQQFGPGDGLLGLGVLELPPPATEKPPAATRLVRIAAPLLCSCIRVGHGNRSG